MERKQFLRRLGTGAAFALTFPCAYGCSKDEVNGQLVAQPTDVDFTVDLTSSEGAKLATNGSYILKNLVVVVKDLEGNFIAATQICSHQAYDQVRFIHAEGGMYYCDVHGSKFDLDGAPLNQVDDAPAKPIKVYNTELNGDILRVFE